MFIHYEIIIRSNYLADYVGQNDFYLLQTNT
jgi:hypothetical protein